MFLPPMTHIPIFITATLVLRDACARAASALSISPSSLSDLLAASPASTLTSSALTHLHELASTPFLWCPSLVLPDSTMFLPLGVGLAALLNVEVTAKTRRTAAAAAEAVERPQVLLASGPSPSSSAPGGPPTVSASERRRLLARRARDGAPNARVRGLATRAPAAAPPASAGAAPSQVELPRKPSNERLVTNMLRCAAVAFIPLAGMAPAVRCSSNLALRTRGILCELALTLPPLSTSAQAVCVYWVTSNLFTLVQNLGFWWLDRRRERERRMRDILSGRSVGV